MTTRSLVVLSAGVSVPSSTRLLADRLTEAVVRALGERGETVSVELVELRDLAHELTDQLLTGVPGERVERVQNSLAAADALIAVTPVFAAAYSGLFKTFVDLLEPGLLAGKPVLLGATAGTARHSLALDQTMRPLFGYLRAQVTPTGVVAATSDFGADGSPADGAHSEDDLATRIGRAARELAALVALGDTAAPVSPPSPVSRTLTPFEQLLAGRR